MSQERIIQLEEELAHQAMEVTRLSEELYKQQKELALLHKQFLQLKQSLQGMSLIRTSSEEDAPPHY